MSTPEVKDQKPEEKDQKPEEKKFPRAKKFARLIKKGRNGTIKYQAYRPTPHFKRSARNLLKIKRAPKYLKKSIKRENTWNRFSILLAPCKSERFYKKMENENTIIFYVDQKASKKDIRNAFNEAFSIKPEKIRTMNTITGKKKAFIKLPKGNEASEIASKIGLI